MDSNKVLTKLQNAAKIWPQSLRVWVSVTRLGDLLDFGELLKAYGNNKFAQISHILRQFLYMCQKLSFF